ncbi:hypothetical protein [Halobacteriovorax sp. HLS]|uniref:hypothetical protein n=1 Tax=Halobacteriovorax sp. HLS TaxID=2234000 RepID=UPI000FD78D1C|nr:hypothetical protein [Halobacteriovorax sp. HLS]
MRNTSVQRFYTENINKYFGILCNSKVTHFDSVLENRSVTLKWKSVHHQYLSSNEALVLGIKMLSDETEVSHNAHDMFDHALNCDELGSESEQLIHLAMGIFYFKRALNEKDLKKQNRILKLSEYYIKESIKLNVDCHISKLHFVLVKIALQEFGVAVKELVRFAKESEESKIYELLFKIYQNMELPNIALYYSLKASKGKKSAIL